MTKTFTKNNMKFRTSTSGKIVTVENLYTLEIFEAIIPNKFYKTPQEFIDMVVESYEPFDR